MSPERFGQNSGGGRNKAMPLRWFETTGGHTSALNVSERVISATAIFSGGAAAAARRTRWLTPRHSAPRTVLTFRHTSEGRRSGYEATARHRFHAATTRPGPPCAGANNYDAMQGLHCTDCSMRAAAVASVAGHRVSPLWSSTGQCAGGPEETDSGCICTAWPMAMAMAVSSSWRLRSGANEEERKCEGASCHRQMSTVA